MTSICFLEISINGKILYEFNKEDNLLLCSISEGSMILQNFTWWYNMFHLICFELSCISCTESELWMMSWGTDNENDSFHAPTGCNTKQFITRLKSLIVKNVPINLFWLTSLVYNFRHQIRIARLIQSSGSTLMNWSQSGVEMNKLLLSHVRSISWLFLWKKNWS